MLSTRFFAIVATWAIVVATAHENGFASAPLVSLLFLPLTACSRIVVYGPWQLSDLGGDALQFVLLAGTLASALFLTLVIVGYATKQFRRGGSEGAEGAMAIGCGEGGPSDGRSDNGEQAGRGGPEGPGDGEPEIRPDESTAIKERFHLTNRECEVMELLAKGYSQKKIAETLVLSVSSVQSYSKAVYRKLGVHSRQEVIDLVESGGSA